MTDNEYKPKEELPNSKESKSTTKKEKVDTKTTSQKSKNPIEGISNRFDKKKVKSTIGVLLVLLSLYLFLACLSYLFTWKVDQDRVLGVGLFEFLLDSNPEPLTNWLGKFGAWSSHLLVFKWFGLPSFGLIFLLFLTGFKVLFNITLLPMQQTYSRVALIVVWASMFLGYFAHTINFLGGSFGYYVNHWLALTFGRFGAFIFIGVLAYIVVLVLFNPNFKALFDRLIGPKSTEDDTAQSNAYDRPKFNDIHVINPIKENDIAEDFVSETVHFGEEEEEEEEDFEFDSSELIISMKEETKADSSLDGDDDFEIEIPEGSPEISSSIGNLGESFSVAVAPPDEALTDSDLDKLRKEYGDYDPTLDLSSYVLPSIDLLKDYGTGGISVNKQELEDNKNKIVETLSHYKIDIAKIKATVGPTVTLYEIVPAPGVRISKIKNLEDDIALSLSALGIRIIAPIPGKGTIGIEVPNSNPEMVSMRSLIASEKFQNSDFELPIVMGKTITNETFVFDLTKMPHLLVAGATGQGKSVGLNAILISILYKKHPAQVKFVLVDPKKVELTLYNKIERHFLAKLPGEGDAIITDVSKVVATLNSLCIEMDDRYEMLKDAGVRTIKEYNTKFISRKLNPEKGHRYLPYIIVLIDEFADLIMTAGKEVEHPIARIAQLARAIGIHLIVATQRPSVNVITGMIKANFPARIAFRVLSKIDSRTILDASGADQLIGRGDMLISTGSDIKRLQCGFVDTPEVEEICSFIGDQRAYPEALLLPEYIGEGGDGSSDIDMNELDVMFADAARIVVINQQGSASLLQRKLKLGYNRAGRIVDQLEGMGIIGAFQGSKAREVLYSDVESLDELMRSKGII
jgi:S-DNA-T family DNA segregation ATPase FtsK/SpoIIIE